jgi:hypothetical protein
VELLEDGLHVALDRTRAQVELPPDRPVRAALGEQRQHPPLPVRELVERRAAVTANEALHHLRVERGSARCDALDRVNELSDVAHAVFEEVAENAQEVANRALEPLGLAG